MSLIFPDEKMQIIIRTAVNEDVNTREDYLNTIKEWLRLEPHLPDSLDDVMLMNTLRSCSFSLEKCKRKLDMYFTSRCTIPEFYSNRNLNTNKELIRISELVTFATLPGFTKDGRRISFYRIKNKDLDTRLEDTYKLSLMILDVRLKLEENGASGEIIILDSATLPLSQLSQFTPEFIKKIVFSAFVAFPMKLKQYHVINCHPIAQPVLNMFKMLLKKKIADRVYLHSGDHESLYKFVERELLPLECGGNAGSLQDLHDKWMQKLKENGKWFDEQDNLKSDESKRVGKSKYANENFGVDGSFMKLNID